MPKGMFTQAVTVLLDRPAELDAIAEALPDYEIIRRNDEFEAWEFGGCSLTVAFKPEINGLVSIDAVDQPWPDGMGDPKLESKIFGAWSMGFFGPFTYPSGLERAGQQCWGWKAGRQIAALHRAFVRIRASYAFGARMIRRSFPPNTTRSTSFTS